MSETDEIYGEALSSFADEYNLEFTISTIEGVMGVRNVREGKAVKLGSTTGNDEVVSILSDNGNTTCEVEPTSCEGRTAC